MKPMQLTLANPNLAYDTRFDSIHHWIADVKRRAARPSWHTAYLADIKRVFEYIDVLPSVIMENVPSELWGDYGRAFFGDVKLYRVYLKTASGIKKQKNVCELTPTKPKSGNFTYEVFR